MRRVMRASRVTSHRQYEELLRLLCEKPLRNVMLVQNLCAAWGCGGSVFVSGEDGCEGVLALRPCQTADFSHIGCLSAANESGARCLLGSIPLSAQAYIRVCGAGAARWVAGITGQSSVHKELFYRVHRETFRAGEGHWHPRELRIVDRGLIGNAGGWSAALLGVLGAGHKAFGVVLGGKLLAYCWAGSASPSASGIDLGIYSICGLYTAADWRRRGIATELVAYATEECFSQAKWVIYYTEEGNEPSQRTARRVGYARYMVVTDFMVRKVRPPRQLIAK
jgi:ribosomal protein S18 acetylase RimI-like enzyme